MKPIIKDPNVSLEQLVEELIPEHVRQLINLLTADGNDFQPNQAD